MAITAKVDERAVGVGRRPPAGPPSLGTRVWAFSSSLRLLLFILFVGVVPLTVGTFFIQKPLGGFDAQKEIERIGPHLYALLETLGIYNIYHSWYFQGILVLLSYNNICCTIDRFFVKTRRITGKAVGVIIVHIGVNVVLAGAYYGSRSGVEGFMQVFENAPAPTGWMFNTVTGARIPLPFAVQLDDFRLVMYDEPDERVFLLDPATRETRAHVRLDLKRPFPQTYAFGAENHLARLWRVLRGGPRNGIRVEAYYPDAVQRPVARPTGDPNDMWVVELRSSTRDEIGQGFLVADSPNRMSIVPGKVSVGYTRTRTPEGFARALAAEPAPDKAGPTLLVRDLHSGVVTPYPVSPGDRLTLGDDAFVEVLEYVPDFVRGPGGDVQTKSDAPNNPALRVTLRDNNEERTGWLLAKFTGVSAVSTRHYALNFGQGRHPQHTPQEVDIVAGPAGERKLVHRVDGRVQTLVDTAPDTIFALEEFGTQLQVLGFTDGAEFEFEVVNESDEPHNPAIQFTLIQDGAPVMTDWLFAGQAVDAPGDAGRLVYDRNFGIREFQSDLSVFKDGRKIVDRQEIIVNRYLDVEGYHIYQASYDDQEGRWSGLQIKRDPGIPVVYTGFVLMFVGVFFLFYVRPWIEARRKGRPLVPEAGTDGAF